MNQEFFTTNIIDNLIKVMKVLTQFSPHPEAGVKGLQGSLRYFTGSDFPFLMAFSIIMKIMLLLLKMILLRLLNFLLNKMCHLFGAGCSKRKYLQK